MEMNSTTWTELHKRVDLQEEKGVNLKIKIHPVHHMQEAMQLMLMRNKLKGKQETKIIIRIKVQEETKDSQPEVDTIRWEEKTTL